MSLQLTACLLVFAAAATPAAAEDKKNYPGLACLASNNAITDITRNASNARALNSATNTVTFLCPVVKDQVSMDLDSATMYVLDQRPDDNVSCMLRSGGVSGTWFSTDATTTAFYGSTPAQLTFAGIGGNFWDSYWFQCTVPGPNTSDLKSGVVMYQTKEQS